MSETITLRVDRRLIEAVERGGDSAIRTGWTETAVALYSHALVLRTLSGIHPLRRADDEPST